MIAAARLSAVWQVAGVAAVALCCYLVSQSVAAERVGLAKVDRQITESRDAIAKLTTEITTRSRLTQIESWNRQLALQAPRPAQYVESGIRLASLYAHDARPQLPLDPNVVPGTGPIQEAAYQARPQVAPAAPSVNARPPLLATGPAPLPKVAPTLVVKLERPPIQQAAFRPAPKPLLPDALAAPAHGGHAKAREDAPPAASPAAPLLQAAAFVRPRASRLDAAAPAEQPLLSADIASLAKAEQRQHKSKKAGE